MLPNDDFISVLSELTCSQSFTCAVFISHTVLRVGFWHHGFKTDLDF